MKGKLKVNKKNIKKIYLELTDRTNNCNLIIERLLLDNPTVSLKENNKAKKHIIKAQIQLGKAYQIFGLKT